MFRFILGLATPLRVFFVCRTGLALGILALREAEPQSPMKSKHSSEGWHARIRPGSRPKSMASCSDSASGFRNNPVPSRGPAARISRPYGKEIQRHRGDSKGRLASVNFRVLYWLAESLRKLGFRHWPEAFGVGKFSTGRMGNFQGLPHFW
jgi:hypothetical protein